MSALAPILSVLRARWFWTLVGALLLALIVWFFGDLLGVGERRPLGDPLVRLLVSVGILLLWMLLTIFWLLRARRSNQQLVSALAEPVERSAPGDADLDQLARRFSQAMEQLKRSRFGQGSGKRWLYQLPWYVMIGPPGTGKTTALAQSGLRFPLGQAQDLRGVGGTRYCDWIFTDEAVLIDTAGRYTSQDSDGAQDRAAWHGFLDLLKKHRPRQPLNGVLVAISTRELLGGRASVEEHAARIRARLAEIEERLRIRLPVYLLVTKADLVAGFDAFFEDLGERDREQVWGFTFEHEPGRPEQLDLAALGRALDVLVVRLDQRLPRLLGQANDVERRARIFGFPPRIQELKAELLRFVERCFPATSYEKGGWLRGVYLTSATQTGTPIDRLMAAIGTSLGLPATPAPAVQGDRAFFLTRLLKEVVFGEASLVGRDLRRERRDRVLHTATIAGLALLATAAVALWSWSFMANRDRQYALESALGAWAQQAAPLARANLPASDGDYLAAVRQLDALAALGDQLAPPEPLRFNWGLSQRARAAEQIDVAYRRALVDLLLPRLLLATERDLRRRRSEPDYVLEALKIYMMLGGGAPVDPPGLIETWYGLDAEQREPALAGSVRRHTQALAALLPEVENRPSLDPDLLNDAKTALGQIPLAKRAYDALIAMPGVRDLPGWKLTDHAGPNAALTLVRRSGQPLGAELPAIYTHAGFHEVFLPRLDEVASTSFAEAWVLSGRGRPEPDPREIERIKTDMLRLYYDDAIAAWEGLLRDVTLQPLTSLDKAAEATRALGGPNSPIKLLIEAVVRETALTVPPPDPAAAPPDLGKPAQALDARLGKLARLVADQRGRQAPAAEPLGQPVEAHFAYLKGLVEGVGGAPPALDEAIAALRNLDARLSEAALSPNPAQAFTALGPTGAAELARAAQDLPAPLGEMLAGVAAKASSLSSGGIRQQLNTVWRGDVLPFCRKAIGSRFPFAPGSAVDASVDDVARLFGPGGLIPSFVDTQLAPFVDTSRATWRDERGIGLAAGALAALARAERIGMALFPGGAGLKSSFNLTPLSLDAGAASVTLDVDGQEVRYAHGPARPTPLSWPGPGGTGIVRLSFAPFHGGAPVTITKEGPWSLFRLLSQASFARTEQPDLFEVTFAVGGHEARFRLRAASVENPFDLRVLAGFACPEGL